MHQQYETLARLSCTYNTGASTTLRVAMESSFRDRRTASSPVVFVPDIERPLLALQARTPTRYPMSLRTQWNLYGTRESDVRVAVVRATVEPGRLHETLLDPGLIGRIHLRRRDLHKRPPSRSSGIWCQWPGPRRSRGRYLHQTRLRGRAGSPPVRLRGGRGGGRAEEGGRTRSTSARGRPSFGIRAA